MNKIGIISIVILVTVVLTTSGCISVGSNVKDHSNQTKSFSGYNISFNYSGNFDLHINPDDPNGNIMISATKGSFLNPVLFQVTILPNVYKSQEYAIDEQRKTSVMGCTRISSGTTTIDNITAYDDVYKGRTFPFIETIRLHMITFTKDDNVYVMMLQAPDNDFTREKPNFDTILNSFKFNDD